MGTNMSPGRGLALVIGVALCAAAASACDDPVYLYTLNNWAREPCILVQFVEDEATDENATESAISNLKTMGKANLRAARFTPPDLEGIPAASPVRRAWEERGEHPLPFWAVLAPNGQRTHAGALTPEDVAALASSPQRLRLCELLTGGMHGAFLLLTCSDPEANAAAGSLIEASVAEAAKSDQEPGYVTVERDDPAEKWLVRHLLAIREGLAGLDAPMLFGVFARGFVMAPLVGKGITRDGISALIAFFHRPCSCDILSQVTGTYLLTDFDWAAALPEAAPIADERPYYSLLTPPSADLPERVDSSAARQSSHLLRNALVALTTVLAFALLAGHVLLRKRRD